MSRSDNPCADDAEEPDRLCLAHRVFTHARDGITVTDPQGTIIDVNAAFERITGYERAQVLGKNPRLLKSGLHDADFYRVMWEELLSKGAWQGEIWNRRRDGSVYCEFLTISAVRDDQGKLLNFIGIFSDVTRRINEYHRELDESRCRDRLTGLGNAAMIRECLSASLERCRHKGGAVLIACLDLDDFARINQTYGHDIGDHVLVQVAENLKSDLGDAATLGRVGGDEFLVLVPLGDPAGRDEVLQRLSASVSRPVVVHRDSITMSASVGVTLFPEDGGNADTVLRHANQAMHEAKWSGGGRWQIFDLGHDKDRSAFSRLVNALEGALENDEFRLLYQPKVHMPTGRIIGAEALLSWHDPKRGRVSPEVFLGKLDRHPLALQIGDWVLERAMQQLSDWHAQGIAMPLSVNVIAMQLEHPEFITRFQERLSRHQELPVDMMELEIVESVAIQNIKEIGPLIQACKAIGLRISVDDFGTGYATLSYLKHLPADFVKIDRGFVLGMLKDPGDLAIVKGIIGLAKAFSMGVIAEGVESELHGLKLIKLGCDIGQGYFIARPMPPDDLIAWARSWTAPESWLSAACSDLRIA